jgi:multisubunit Na+/H+ antiporter MnhB subunit
MSGANLANIVIGVAVLALFLSRQLVTRRLSESYRLSIILAIIGVVEFATFLKGHPNDDGGIAEAVVGSLVIAAVFGAVRALTVRVWRENGQLLRKGTWVTAVLWVLSLAAHLGYDDLVAGHITGKNGGNVGDATILLYLVVTLTIQRFVLLNRVARQEAAGQLPGESQQVPLGS